MISYCSMESPVGRLLLAADEDGLRELVFVNGRVGRGFSPADDWCEDAAPLRAVLHQLEEYFAGRRRTFDVPLAPRGTAFQLRVWRELLNIAYGETISYGELARRIGNPNASRAVGLANGANPISIIVPCHRVIGSNGTLTGYGGGLDTKKWLLAHERGQGQFDNANAGGQNTRT